MIVSPWCRVLVFQEMPYRCIPCRIVSHVVPVSVLHRFQFQTLCSIEALMTLCWLNPSRQKLPPFKL